MNMMKHASLALTLVFGVTLFGASAFAQLLDSTGSVILNDSTTSNETSVDAAVDASLEVGASATSTEDGEEADAGSSFSFSIERDAMDPNTDYAVTDADLVRSEASLESYASATVRADERLESLMVEDGRMDMTYRKDAKFLWFIPTSMHARVTVDANGEVSVRYPWYSFLMKVDESRADLEARLTSEIRDINNSIEIAADAELSGETSTGIQADPEVRRWARIIESAYVAVSGSTRVDASAQAQS